MLDWLIVAASLIAWVWVTRLHFPPRTDPKHWKAPGLSMTVRDGKIHYRKKPQ